LATHGITLPPGTLAGGLERIAPMFEPLYLAIEQHCQAVVKVEQKVDYKRTLWVYRSPEAIFFAIALTKGKLRVAAWEQDPQGPKFAQHDAVLRARLEDFRAARDEQWQQQPLPATRKRILSSLVRPWEGLLVFVDHPEVPMDNSEAERRLRGPAMGRKNYWGSGATWAGELAERCFSLFATLLLAGLNVRTWLTAFLTACAEAGGLRLELVTRQRSALWNEYIDRYHYLGYTPLVGAQLRYWVSAEDRLLALFGYGASAWRLAPRDRWIGWNDAQRQAALPHVVGQVRFLILPWLLESFVDRSRFEGTCYRAANWIDVGQTQGRGKKDRHGRPSLPRKQIYLYPLCRNCRTRLTNDSTAHQDLTGSRVEG
jgi:hypothetical protein